MCIQSKTTDSVHQAICIVIFANCILYKFCGNCFPAIPRDHPESYHYYMWNNFLKHIDIKPENAHILDGNADDLVGECDDFERRIAEAGGIELFIGGVCVGYRNCYSYRYSEMLILIIILLLSF